MNERYMNSFGNDPNLAINVKIKNFIFIMVSICYFKVFNRSFSFWLFFIKTLVNWSDPNVVGDPNYPSWNTRPVLVATPTLNRFIDFMNSQKLPFDYDYATGWVT